MSDPRFSGNARCDLSIVPEMIDDPLIQQDLTVARSQLVSLSGRAAVFSLPLKLWRMGALKPQIS